MQARVDRPRRRHNRSGPVFACGCLLGVGLALYCVGYVGVRESHLLVHHDGMITGAMHQVRPALSGSARAWVCASPALNCWAVDVVLPCVYAPLVTIEEVGWQLSSY